MKICILYDFIEGPYGGANQFLKGLRKIFIKKGCYEENENKADVILVNSYPNKKIIDTVRKLKRLKNSIVIHRIAGPIYLGRGRDLLLDKLTYMFNKRMADGTIFQSEWSKKENKLLGLRNNQNEITIINAPDDLFFNKSSKRKINKNKIKLIATSWSPNPNKGFDVYQWLDKNLDFNKIKMTIVGNTPVHYKNIKTMPPISSSDLSREIKRHDIFVFASKIEACSNSLLEAIHCGLPAIVFNGSSNTEIIGKGGEVFKKPEEIPLLIGKIAARYDDYCKELKLPDIYNVANEYYEFIYKIYTKCKRGDYNIKKTSFYREILIDMIIFKLRVFDRMRWKNIINKSLTKVKKVAKQYI